jgi:hypothetical protein
LPPQVGKHCQLRRLRHKDGLQGRLRTRGQGKRALRIDRAMRLCSQQGEFAVDEDVGIGRVGGAVEPWRGGGAYGRRVPNSAAIRACTSAASRGCAS